MKINRAPFKLKPAKYFPEIQYPPDYRLMIMVGQLIKAITGINDIYDKTTDKW